MFGCLPMWYVEAKNHFTSCKVIFTIGINGKVDIQEQLVIVQW